VTFVGDDSNFNFQANLPELQKNIYHFNLEFLKWQNACSHNLNTPTHRQANDKTLSKSPIDMTSQCHTLFSIPYTFHHFLITTPMILLKQIFYKFSSFKITIEVFLKHNYVWEKIQYALETLLLHVAKSHKK
jgi:hypothetical protein